MGLNINKEYFAHPEKTSIEVKKEISNGLKCLKKIDSKLVTVFGSHLVKPKDVMYKKAYALTNKLGKKGYGVMSGGGPGIMYAANKGAMDAKAPSIGVKASLIKGEDNYDDIFTEQLAFKYLFVRRFILAIKSSALIFFPGGYGTLNEFFEYAVLMQIKMVDKVPIICVGKEYWEGLFNWLEHGVSTKAYFIDKDEDLGLINIVDDVDEIMSLL